MLVAHWFAKAMQQAMRPYLDDPVAQGLGFRVYRDLPCTLNWGYMVPNSGYLGPNRG